MEEVTYYARFDWGGTPKKPDSVVRRRIADGVVHDEIFTQRLQWEPINYFVLYSLGHDDDRYEEITKEEADAFINRPRRRNAASSEPPSSR